MTTVALETDWKIASTTVNIVFGISYSKFVYTDQKLCVFSPSGIKLIFVLHKLLRNRNFEFKVSRELENRSDFRMDKKELF